MLVILGVPLELVSRMMGIKWTLHETVSFMFSDGRTLTARKGLKYDSFTASPNLRRVDGSKSLAAGLHDWGWTNGKKDDGSMLTFDENNLAFKSVLDMEKHSDRVKKLYVWGVSLPTMRRMWRKKFGHE